MANSQSDAADATGGRLGLAVGIVLLLTLLVPIWWGADGHNPWDVDNTAPGPVLRELATRFHGTHVTQYGPVAYYPTAAFYVPILLAVRATGELGQPASDYPWGMKHPEETMTLLVVAARAVTITIALALLLWLVRAELRHEFLRAPVLLPLVALGSATFVYYARTSNPDLPYVAWLALGLFLLARGERWTDAALAAGAAGLAVATKDQAIAPAMVVILAATVRVLRGPDGGIARALLVPLAAVLVYAVCWRLPWNWEPWLGHVRYVTGSGVDPRRFGLDLQGLLGIAGHYLARAPVEFGWPAILGVIAALVLRVPMRGLGVALLACSAYAATLVSIGYARPRFTLPLLLVVLPLAARGLSAVFDRVASRPGRTGFAAALVVLALVGGPRLSLTQWNDPRLDAEQWLAVHARPGETIEIAGNPKFQARVPRTLSRILTSDDSLAVRPGSPRGTLVLISSIDRYSFTDTPVIRDSWWRELVDGYHIDATFPAPAWARDLTALPVAPMVTIYRRNGSR